mgnify:FL=1
MELKLARSGAPADFGATACYGVTVPRLAVTEGEAAFGDDPSRSGTRFERIDASSLVAPSRWERRYATWLSQQTGADVVWPHT